MTRNSWPGSSPLRSCVGSSGLPTTKSTKATPGVLLSRLRQQLQWPQERFDIVLQGPRAEGHVELARATPDETHAPAPHESYTVHGHLYVRLRWRD